MIAQSFYQNPLNLSRQSNQNNYSVEPDHLILNTSAILKTLRQQIEALESDEHDILTSIFESLQYRNKDTPMEIEYSANWFISQKMGYECIPDFLPQIDAMTEFGNYMFNELQRMQAYRNGYLFYQYRQLIGNDIVLVKLVPPPLTPPRVTRTRYGTKVW
jgi:hypothetical protein